MQHRSTKTYGHERGLSCCFRQWRAKASHCSKLHGYALAVEIEFEADELDERNWVIDFGGMKQIKAYLDATFDHTLVIASDDPKGTVFTDLDVHYGAANVIIMKNVGCEAFAAEIAAFVTSWLREHNHSPRVALHRVTVREHAGNSASFMGENEYG